MKIRLKNVVWKQKNGNFEAHIGKIGVVSVLFTDNGYKVDVFGNLVKFRFDDIETAKLVSLMTAEKLISDVIFVD